MSLLRKLLGGQPGPSARGSVPPPSRFLEQAIRPLIEQGDDPPEILLLGPPRGHQIEYFTHLGCRVAVEDISDFLEAVRERDPEEGGPVPVLHLDHPDGRFPAVVLFDLVDRLDEEPARILVDEVYRLLQPGGWVMALSHSRATGAPEPVQEAVFADLGYRLRKTSETPFRRRVRANRDLMRLFDRFGRQQIQLRVDGMREVLLRRALKG